MQLCQRFPWPGNVRQLRNAVERLVITRRATVVEVAALPDFLRDYDRKLDHLHGAARARPWPKWRRCSSARR